MCSVSYVDFAVRFEDKLTEVNGVPSFRVAKDGRQIYVPAEDFVFIPYMGKTRGESWLATNGDWYLGINANVTDEATLQASRLYLEYVASTEFAPEYYSASVPAGATTYYRRDDVLNTVFSGAAPGGLPVPDGKFRDQKPVPVLRLKSFHLRPAPFSL